jgi:hypothetical protein
MKCRLLPMSCPIGPRPEARRSSFARPVDLSLARAISSWATSGQYEQAAVSTFLQVADYYLVAEAHAARHTIVTHEVPSASRRKIKIPDACIGLGIKFMTPFAMPRHERARFILGPKP